MLIKFPIIVFARHDFKIFNFNVLKHEIKSDNLDFNL